MAKMYKLSGLEALENAFKTRVPAPKNEVEREDLVAKMQPILRDAKARGFSEIEMKNIVNEVLKLALKKNEIPGDKSPVRARKVV